MANILIIDHQEWIVNLCKKNLAPDGHSIYSTDDIPSVMNLIIPYEINLVLLNLYLKGGFLVWEVLRDIKKQNPKLPVLIATKFDTHLFCPQLSEADGYIVENGGAANELRNRISDLLEEKHAF